VSERWLVAMSGGVDSSVAAALLVREGCQAVGVTMDLGGDAGPGRSGRCCGLPDAEDARAVSRALGIRHYVVNLRAEFHEAVVEPFVSGYLEGRTPIPCVACNRELKFDWLLRRAEALGARGVATGHYARIAPGPDRAPALHRAADRDKDQTYFLFDTPRASLERIRFPLGALAKSEVRRLAREAGLVTADKPESQGICFVPEGDVRRALRRLAPEHPPVEGEVTDSEGRVLGRHRGAIGYTVGQRSGLGALPDGPWYVTEVDPRTGRLRVGRRDELRRDRIALRAPVWQDGAPPEGEVRVQVRHRQRAVPGRVREHGLAIELEEPVFAPAPGQAAVVYDERDERLLGGGWIERA
jgi:tRNA-specific 2-thiouridylase